MDLNGFTIHPSFIDLHRSSLGRPHSSGCGTQNVQSGLLQLCAGGTAEVHSGTTTPHPECSCLTAVQPRSLSPRDAEPNPSKLAASQLQSQVQFKLCCIIYAVYYDCSATYMMEAVQSLSASRSGSGLCLCSSFTTLIDYPCPGCSRVLESTRFLTWLLPRGTDNIRTAPIR